MKRITIALLATVASAGLLSSAYAADLIVDEPAPVGVVDVSGSWDGVFVGAFVGYGAGTGFEDDALDGDVDFEYDLAGWLAGVNIGANFTVGSGIVAGVVGDIAWSGITDDDLVDVNWTGSLRGRLGFDGGAFLPYLTAGLAVANVNFDGEEQTHLGWTVGAGVEFAVADNLSVDLLYRYSDYEELEYFAPAGDGFSLNTHQVTVGLNWRF